MQTLALAKYLPDVSSLVYGCMGLGGGWNADSLNADHLAQAHAVVDAALDAGINVFDHADIYTLGKAESVFGQVMKARPELRSQIYLQSKCGIRFEDDAGPKRYDFSREWIASSVDGILQRLGTEYIDVLLLHRPDPLMAPEEIAEIIHSLQVSGKVKHFGVSNMHVHQIAFLQQHLDVPLVANQLEVSLSQHSWVDETVLAGNPVGADLNFTGGTVEYCRAQGVQLQSWGSLCQGLFSGRDIIDQTADVKATAVLVEKMAGKYKVSNEAIVLGWLMRHPANIQPVIGTTSPARIKACAEAVTFSMSREDWYALYVSARGAELP